MMKSSHLTLSLLSLLISHRANADSIQDKCAGTIDGSDNLKQYTENAVQFSGIYTFQNYGTKNNLYYQHTDAPGLVATTKAITSLLKDLGSGPSISATDQFTLFNGEDDQTVVISAGGKCIASQWGFDSGTCDKFCVPYNCITGPDKVDDPTLEVTKPQYLMLPVDLPDSDSTAVQDNAVSSTYKGCPKDAAWLGRHASDVRKGEYLKRHPACKKLMDDDSHSSKMMRMHRRGHNSTKRGSDADNNGAYMIVNRDHLDDMYPRCLGGNQATAYANMPSIEIVPCDPTDPNQFWIVTAA